MAALSKESAFIFPLLAEGCALAKRAAVPVDCSVFRARYALAAIVLLFQFAALQHNLGFWETASARVKAACATGAPELPGSIDGVPALANGRQECIEIGRSTFSRP